MTLPPADAPAAAAVFRRPVLFFVPPSSSSSSSSSSSTTSAILALALAPGGPPHVFFTGPATSAGLRRIIATRCSLRSAADAIAAANCRSITSRCARADINRAFAASSFLSSCSKNCSASCKLGWYRWWLACVGSDAVTRTAATVASRIAAAAAGDWTSSAAAAAAAARATGSVPSLILGAACVPAPPWLCRGPVRAGDLAPGSPVVLSSPSPKSRNLSQSSWCPSSCASIPDMCDSSWPP